MAVLSAFMWDPDWILNKVDVVNTDLMMVMQAKDEAEVYIASLGVWQAAKSSNS